MGGRNGGRHKTDDGVYAKELGIHIRKVRALGGAAKLRPLSPDVLAILLAPANIRGNGRKSVQVHSGGMAARGMYTRVRGVDSQQQETAA